ncbi:substrate-binding domain-containing protein [Actinocorallia longicatena]|uniref:Substrate-binding domain-containing protein n=1 Tax=Actinocorallia longicatena TaxID=111803 RepID=A0ABP6QNR3_9ACTN
MGDQGTYDVALVVPAQGPTGLFGPSCELSARLAVEEINERSGVLGRAMRLVMVDGGAAPLEVAREVGGLVGTGGVDAVIGWHTSAVRESVAPVIVGRVPYIYTTLYEGGEDRPWVFPIGETPRRQLRPALHWFAGELGVRRWTVVGNDYVWPRASAGAVREYLRELGGSVLGEHYVPLGTEDYGRVLGKVMAAGCEAVMVLLMGQDAVAFHRSFAAAGLDTEILRFGPLTDENMLLSMGADVTHGLFASAGYFGTLPTEESLDFSGRYHDRFGPTAPMLTGPGESCYEGVRLLSELLRIAGGGDVARMRALSEGLRYDGPRGQVVMRDRHLSQKVFLAVADGLEFDVIHQL